MSALFSCESGSPETSSEEEPPITSNDVGYIINGKGLFPEGVTAKYWYSTEDKGFNVGFVGKNVLKDYPDSSVVFLTVDFPDSLNGTTQTVSPKPKLSTKDWNFQVVIANFEEGKLSFGDTAVNAGTFSVNLSKENKTMDMTFSSFIANFEVATGPTTCFCVEMKVSYKGGVGKSEERICVYNDK